LRVKSHESKTKDCLVNDAKIKGSNYNLPGAERKTGGRESEKERRGRKQRGEEISEDAYKHRRIEVNREH